MHEPVRPRQRLSTIAANVSACGLTKMKKNPLHAIEKAANEKWYKSAMKDYKIAMKLYRAEKKAQMPAK